MGTISWEEPHAASRDTLSQLVAARVGRPKAMLASASIERALPFPITPLGITGRVRERPRRYDQGNE